MFEYLKYLLKKLKSIDQRLSNIALLKEKFWIRINDNNVQEKWFFRSNGKLIVSINGNVIDGFYEHLNQSNLIIGFENKKILLNQNFLYKDILMLNKDSDESDFYAFYDGSKFSHEEFLKFFKTLRTHDLNIKKIQLSDNTTAEIVMDTNQQTVSLGNSVLINRKLTSLNSIETENNFYELKNGIIHKIYYKCTYRIFDKKITVKQKWKTVEVNDEVVFSDQPIEDGYYKINFNIGIEIKERRVKTKYHITFIETFYKKHKIEIWSRHQKEFTIGAMVFENGKIVPNSKYWISLFNFIKVVNGKII